MSKVVSYECFICKEPAVRRYQVLDLPARQELPHGHYVEMTPSIQDSIDVCVLHMDKVRFAGTSSFIVREPGDAAQ